MGIPSIRTYDDLFGPPDAPLSRLYHEESKLGDRRAQAFRERIAAFSADAGAVRQAARAAKPYPTRPAVPLPRAPRWGRGRRLRDVLDARRSRRGPFADRPVPLKWLGGLLDLACGQGGEVRRPDVPDLSQPLRRWPSAGALYPIETYVAPLRVAGLPGALYHYQPGSHALARLADLPADADLRRAVYAEGLWEHAGLLVVLTGVFARTRAKYGERGYRFVLLEAGHVAQNLLLAAEDLGLGAAPLGGFYEDEIGRWLGLEADDESPVYAMLLGARE